MKARHFLFNALTICSLGMAALATQAVTHQSAQAEPRSGADADVCVMLAGGLQRQGL